MLERMKKPSYDEGGILVQLLRDILLTSGLLHTVNWYINRYHKKDKTKTKSTIYRLLEDGSISWKSFTFLIFSVFNFKWLKITIRCFKDNEETEVSKNIKPKDLLKPDQGEILKKLLYEILEKLDVDVDKSIKLYIKEGGKKPEPSIKKILGSERITWKSFIFFLFEILKIGKLEIEVEAKHETGRIFNSSLIVSRN